MYGWRNWFLTYHSLDVVQYLVRRYLTVLLQNCSSRFPHIVKLGLFALHQLFNPFIINRVDLRNR